MSADLSQTMTGDSGHQIATAAVFPLTQRRRKTMGQDVLGSLREAIVMGTIPPGFHLRLKELSGQLGVSASPIREALKQLEILGLAEHLPYRGTRVSALSIEEMQETYEIRAVLESLAVRRAAERFSDEDASACRAALADIAEGYEAGDGTRVIHGNTAFHLAIAAAARSATLLRLTAAVCETSERYSASLLRSGSADMRTIERDGHHAILDACIHHDLGRAEQAVRAHIAVFEQLCTTQMNAAPTLQA